MTTIRTLLTVLLTSFSLSLLAQTGRISGEVGDPDHKPIEAATVSLLRQKDSSAVGQTVTDRSGKFVFDKIEAGRYLVSATSIGHDPRFSPVFEISANAAHVNLKPLTLNAVTGNLQAVSVVGKKPFIEQKADRMVINVDASPSNAGATALDVLEKSPGVTLDKDDNISLKGKQGVTVMIDNKPTYLNATQLASYLKGLPASTIDQIEIMTNPSAKYDAAGNSGIINIKTKKNKTKGFNGSVNLTHTQGVYPKPSGNVNLNYRNGRFNIFLNGGYSRWQGFQHLDISRTYLDPGADRVVNSIFTQGTEIHFSNPSMNIKFGMDYYLSNRTTLGFVVSGFENKENNRSTSDISLKDPHGHIDSTVSSPSTTHNRWKNGSVNLNFRHQFDSSGRELTADLDYVRYSSGSSQYFDNITHNPNTGNNSETILTGDLPATINIYTFKTDYTHPIGKDMKIEAGLKSSYVNTDNMANYFNVIHNVPEVDTSKTNHFLYRENINAAYLNFSRQYKKWGIQTGLRLENTNYSGHQLGNGYSQINRDSSFSPSYFSLFPTAYVSYAASEKNQFSLNYGRRIDRPAYQDLNPFLFFLDQYTYQAGNPYLQPQFSHNIELNYTYAGFLFTTANYSYTRNFFSETFEQSGRATIVRNGNIGSRQNAGISVSAQLHVTKWWLSILYTNFNYTKFKGHLYGEPIDVGAGTFLANVNNQFTFPHGWSAEISGWYRTKGVEGQVIIYPLGQASAAVSKKILKDKGSVKLGIRDFLYTNAPHGYIDFQQTEASFHNHRDSRQVSLTLSYRFGKPMKAQARRRAGGAGEEESRVKAGGSN